MRAKVEIGARSGKQAQEIREYIVKNYKVRWALVVLGPEPWEKGKRTTKTEPKQAEGAA